MVRDDGKEPEFGSMPETDISETNVREQREKRIKQGFKMVEDLGDEEEEDSDKKKKTNKSPTTSGGTLKTTGQLGDVMRESATIAHTFAKGFVAQRDPGNKYFDSTKLHLHVPAGSTPKDGPSAGCTMVTAMVSLATNKAVKPNLAMTGEVTLTGIVMPIGGVKEKTIAARRSGVTTILFPEGNRNDFSELSDDIKEGLEVHFVSTYEDVYKHALECE